ncbi:MAG: hypothetical protein M1819_000693 [Sarea resinae]|nr:MAG: hypothetical protein M1819_000693 [Sarea resinae]
MTLVTTDEYDPLAEYISFSHGVYSRNAHGQEILLKPQNITWRTIGGSIDLYFYAGPSQQEVTQSYQKSAIGLPAMQQYFTFGFHQCRWGYQNWSVVEDVVANFERFGIPLENIWSDIDYMNQYRDFENDQNTFGYAEGQKFLASLHASGRHYIPIVDSAIYIPNPENASDAYPIFDRGNAADSFMKNPDGSLYIGQVWPGYTVFPDWESAGAVPWWTDELVKWHDQIPFDGIWIDMNEVSSFCVGSCGSANRTLNPVHPGFALPGEPGNLVLEYPEAFNATNATEAASASSAAAAAASSTPTATSTSNAAATMYVRSSPTPGTRNINDPPYVINNVQGDLAVHAVSPNATHIDGSVEYDIHNLFGHQILNATYNALLNVFPGKRPFIIGRSTFAGSGMFAGHWGGDNMSRWAYMFFSIPQALSFSLFGIPMFGVDTCGFNDNSDEELCNRWMQLSAFFPFYRNHNTIGAIGQEPYVWASVTEASIAAMSIRYQLLPYMYTLFHFAHTTGSTVMRALAWEFPNDPSLAAADRQFLLGPSILVTPVLEPQAVTVDGVFPGISQGEVWYDWYNQSAVSAVAGQNTTINAPLGHIPVYVRGGSVLPLQQAAMTTAKARATPWSLIAALGRNGTAEGALYLDDGESLVPADTLLVNFTVANNTLSAASNGTYPDANPLSNITVLGVLPNQSSNQSSSQTSTSLLTFTASLNGVALDAADVAYNATSNVLLISHLDALFASGAWKESWSISWELRT